MANGINGRTARGRFWLAALVVWAVFYLLSSLIDARPESHAWEAAVWVINLPAVLALWVLCVRRLHDQNRSGWWLLAVVVPVLGAAWLVWRLGFKRGTADRNRWGAAPGQQAGDFLRV
jgi:uncharacterized membrane protein YhaH (DUF805 family)